jgi:GT2 family glycosyltransferase
MIHILLPVHNRVALTCGFVESLRGQTLSDFHLVLVDDGCTDGTAKRVRALLPQDRLTVLTGTGAWWWAGSLDQAYRHLLSARPPDEDLVLIVNDDVTIKPDFLEMAAAAYRRAEGNAVEISSPLPAGEGWVRAEAPDASMRSSQAQGAQALTPTPLPRGEGLNSTLLRAGGGLVLAQHWLPERAVADESGVAADLENLQFPIAREPRQINCLSTRGLVLSWGTMKAIGGFHPRLLPHYLSDFEYTLRAYRKGYSLTTDPAFHLTVNPETTGYHGIDPSMPVFSYLRRLFSTKSAQNPLHWTAFVVLTCPPLKALNHAARIWLSVLRTAMGLARRQYFNAHG